MSNENTGGRLRPQLTLRIAITGHWGFDSEAQKESIKKYIILAVHHCAKALKKTQDAEPELFNDGTNSPPVLALLTALAEGADQLAVDAFREADIATAVIRRVEAVLPFVVEDYARTMSVDAAAIMRRIAGPQDANTHVGGRADRVMILADRALTHNTDDPEERRFVEQRYATIGDILVRQADVLISVWNGVGKTGIGGTSYVTALALRQGLPVLWIDTLDGVLKLMTTPDTFGDVLTRSRASALRFSDEPDDTHSIASAKFLEMLNKILRPDVSAAKHRQKNVGDSRLALNRYFGIRGSTADPAPARTWFTGYKHWLWLTGSDVKLDNHSIKTLDAEHRRGWPIERLRILTVECDDVRKDLSNRPIWDTPGLSHVQVLRAPWGHADAIASRLGHIYRSCYARIFQLSALAVIVALVGAMNPDIKPPMLALELWLLILGAAIYWWSERFNIHGRFLDARGIAEELRPAWVLAQLGLGGRRVLTAHASWPVWATQSWIAAVGLPDFTLDRRELIRICNRIRSEIVVDQTKYHVGNAVRLRLFHHALERFGILAFSLAFVIGAIYLIATTILGLHPDAFFTKAVVIAGAGLPAVAAALAGIRYQGDFYRFSERAAETARELQRIDNALKAFACWPENTWNSTDQFAELRDIIIDLEGVLLNDLDDWRFVYRARPTPEPG